MTWLWCCVLWASPAVWDSGGLDTLGGSGLSGGLWTRPQLSKWGPGTPQAQFGPKHLNKWPETLEKSDHEEGDSIWVKSRWILGLYNKCFWSGGKKKKWQEKKRQPNQTHSCVVPDAHGSVELQDVCILTPRLLLHTRAEGHPTSSDERTHCGG